MASMLQLPLQVATKRVSILTLGALVCVLEAVGWSHRQRACVWTCVCDAVSVGETLRSKFRFYIVFNVKGGNIIE